MVFHSLIFKPLKSLNNPSSLKIKKIIYINKVKNQHAKYGNFI
jgi:hypothetical protein